MLIEISLILNRLFKNVDTAINTLKSALTMKCRLPQESQVESEGVS